MIGVGMTEELNGLNIQRTIATKNQAPTIFLPCNQGFISRLGILTSSFNAPSLVGFKPLMNLTVQNRMQKQPVRRLCAKKAPRLRPKMYF